MKRSGKVIVFALALSMAGFIATARAEKGKGAEGGWVKDACKADVQKLCAEVKPGEGRIKDCLKQHEAELSADCKSNMAKMKEKMQKRMEEINAACKADEEQYCKDVTPGEGREMACLHAHSDKVSDGCKQALKKHHHKKGDMHGKQGGEEPKK
jgi:hypothetical protein